MNSSSSTKGSVTGQRREPVSGATGGSHPRGQDFTLKLHFYCSMHQNRTYPVVVEVPRGQAPPAHLISAPVVVQAVIPGALVTPTKQVLDLSHPGAKVTFLVTPVARGTLEEARLLLLQDGRPVQELPMRMKATSHRTTWLLLLASILLPLAFIHFTVTSPWAGKVPDTRIRLDIIEKNEKRKAEKAAKAAKETEKNAAPAPSPKAPDPPAPKPPGGDVRHLPRAGEPPAAMMVFEEVSFQGEDVKGSDNAGQKPPPPGKAAPGRAGRAGGGRQGAGGPPPAVAMLPEDEDPVELYWKDGKPDEVCRYYLSLYLTKHLPEIPGAPTAYTTVGDWAGTAYGSLCGLSSDMKPGFWLFVFMLLVTFGSWIRNRTQRTSRTRAVTLPMPHPATIRASQSAETLPLAPDGMERVE